MSKVLATYARKTGNGTWQVIEASDGTIYCNCPKWRFQGGVEPTDREPCKHIKLYLAEQKAASQSFDDVLKEVTNELQNQQGGY